MFTHGLCLLTANQPMHIDENGPCSRPRNNGTQSEKKIRFHSKEKRSQSITEAFIHIHTATVETYMCANLYLLGSFFFGKWGSKFDLKHTFDECKGCFYIILPYPCVAEV